MRFFQTFASASVKSGTQAAAVAVPGLGGVGEILSAIIMLCDSVPQNRDAARRLAERCQQLHKALEQYEQTPLPDRTVRYRADVFKCLKKVKDTMEKWSGKGWPRMLVNQGKFERDIDDCCSKISDCFTIFTTASQMELLAQRQEEVERGKKGLKESRDGDYHRKTSFFLREFDAVKFMSARLVTNMVMDSLGAPSAFFF
ncbi:hypothetical protein F5887DRAFT_916690 [Amanita rubescens]|nr:hypothetical protein F5887DRAFT_916690 [Amanita rubescens]